MASPRRPRATVTAVYSHTQDWRIDLPPPALAVGLVAGVSPAVRAARLEPAVALRPS